MLYDFSQVPIPNDAVDDEQVAHPRPWKIEKSGGSSSASGHQLDLRLHDLLRHALSVQVLGSIPRPLFQTGWFVESIMTQTLIIHIIRTNKIPFFQSRASWPLLITTFTIMAFGAWLPYSRWPLRSASPICPRCIGLSSC